MSQVSCAQCGEATFELELDCNGEELNIRAGEGWCFSTMVVGHEMQVHFWCPGCAPAEIERVGRLPIPVPEPPIPEREHQSTLIPYLTGPGDACSVRGCAFKRGHVGRCYLIEDITSGELKRELLKRREGL